MTKQVVAHKDFAAECEYNWDVFVNGLIGNFILGGIITSIAPALIGLAIPGDGMTRGDTAVQNVVKTHEIVWTNVGKGAEFTLTKTAEFLQSK